MSIYAELFSLDLDFLRELDDVGATSFGLQVQAFSVLAFWHNLLLVSWFHAYQTSRSAPNFIFSHASQPHLVLFVLYFV